MERYKTHKAEILQAEGALEHSGATDSVGFCNRCDKWHDWGIVGWATAGGVRDLRRLEEFERSKDDTKYETDTEYYYDTKYETDTRILVGMHVLAAGDRAKKGVVERDVDKIDHWTGNLTTSKVRWSDGELSDWLRPAEIVVDEAAAEVNDPIAQEHWQDNTEYMDCMPPGHIIQFVIYCMDRGYRAEVHRRFGHFYTTEEVMGTYLGHNPRFPSESEWLAAPSPSQPPAA